MNSLFDKGFIPGEARDALGRWAIGLVSRLANTWATKNKALGAMYVYPKEDAAHLAVIAAEKMGNGYGNKAMTNLVRLADRHQVPVTLHAGLPTLQRFYGRYGFRVVDPDTGLMRREPQTFLKGVIGAPSLTHQPGKLQLHRGGKKRRNYLGRTSLYQKAFDPAEARDKNGEWATGADGRQAVLRGSPVKDVTPRVRDWNAVYVTRNLKQAKFWAREGAAVRSGGGPGVVNRHTLPEGAKFLDLRDRGATAKALVARSLNASPSRKEFYEMAMQAPPKYVEQDWAREMHIKPTAAFKQMVRRAGYVGTSWGAELAVHAPDILRYTGLLKDLGVNSVHSDSDLASDKKQKKKLSIAYNPYGQVLLKASKADQGAVKSVMDRWKAGKLHSGKNGPIVEDQKQAVAIALSEINKSLDTILFGKGNVYHDDDGRFTSADNATQAHGRLPKLREAPIGYTAGRSAGEAIGSVAGTYGGRIAGAALGTALFGAAGTGPGAYAGGLVGGIGGDYLGRKISQLAYQTVNPTARVPRATLGEDVGGGLASFGGYALGGPAGGAVGRVIGPAAVSVAEATGRVLGTAAADIAGTRFGHYAALRVGGVLADRKGATATRYGTDAATDAAIDAATTYKRAVSVLPIKLDAGNPKIGIDAVPAKLRPGATRNDPNDRKMMDSAIPQSRFRALLANREAQAYAGTARRAVNGADTIAAQSFQRRPMESPAQMMQRFHQVASTAQAAPFPWKQSVQKRSLFR